MSALSGVVLRRSTTAQQVADALSDQILAGGFGPGDRLRESALAAELGVARNTMREAVRMLELGGLVRYEVNRGAAVISPTPETVDALYLAREGLEVAAVAYPPTPQQLSAIEAAFDDLATAARTAESRDIVAKDLAFHAALVGLLGSSRIDAFFAELSTELRFYLMVLAVTDREHEDPDLVLREHRPILAAVRAGDHDGAAAAVRAHIRLNARRLKEILARGGQ